MVITRSSIFGFTLLFGIAYFSEAFSQKGHAITTTNVDQEGIRLNKVLKKTHSRRQADAIIASGRITVNGRPNTGAGQRVIPFVDTVELDGKRVDGWEAINGEIEKNSREGISGSSFKSQQNIFEYVKYWKPRGVICTTDLRVKGNIIDALTKKSGYRPKNRIFTVGRLDKDSTGLILLTSNGKLPNSILRAENKKAKIYQVTVDRPINDEDIVRLSKGVVIATSVKRPGQRVKTLTAPTLPCKVERLIRNNGYDDARTISIALTEGRNRQIRKMCAALGYEVTHLHRTHVMDIGMGGLTKPGDWAKLNGRELSTVRSLLSNN